MLRSIRKKLVTWAHEAIVHVINTVDGEFEWERQGITFREYTKKAS